MSHVWTSSCPSEHPPVVPEDRPPVLPPGPGVVRPDEGVQVEPHHPDRQRRPRGPSRPEEAGDAAGGARDQGECTTTCSFTHIPPHVTRYTLHPCMATRTQRVVKVLTPPPTNWIYSDFKIKDFKHSCSWSSMRLKLVLQPEGLKEACGPTRTFRRSKLDPPVGDLRPCPHRDRVLSKQTLYLMFLEISA